VPHHAANDPYAAGATSDAGRSDLTLRQAPPDQQNRPNNRISAITILPFTDT
jgi:hypothetical protein